MKRLIVAAVLTLCAGTVVAQGDAIRKPLPATVKAKLGMLNVPALSPLWLLPEYAAKYNIQIETVMFQRFADARTALASGDLDITAFGPQDITLAVAQGAQSLVGVAGVGSGNDCLVVREGEDIRDWKDLGAKRIGIGAGSISWLKFAASVQRLVVAYVDVLTYAQANPQRWSKIYAEKAGLPEAVAAESIRITRLDATLPLASITRISKFLSDNGVIARDVSGEIARHYTYAFLSQATGKSAAELGQNQ